MYRCSGVLVSPSRVTFHCSEKTKEERCRKLFRFACNGKLLPSPDSFSNNDSPRQSQTFLSVNSSDNKIIEVLDPGAVQNSGVEITFRVPLKVHSNERLFLCGSSAEFGNWQFSRAFPMNQDADGVWNGKLRLKSGLYEFKCVRVAGDRVDWEEGHNRLLKIDEKRYTGSKVEVTMEFNETLISEIVKTVRETLVMDGDGNELYLVTGQVHKLTQIDPVPKKTPDLKGKQESTYSERSKNESSIDEYFQSVLHFSKTDVSSLFYQYPDLRFKSVDLDVMPYVELLNEKLGVSYRDIGTLIKKRPSLLKLSVKDVLTPLVDLFLYNLAVTRGELFKFLERGEDLLSFSSKDKINNKIKNLRKVTKLKNFEIGRLVVGNGSLLSLAENKVQERFEHLKSQLNLDDEIKCSKMVLKNPKLLSLEQASISETVSYLTKEQNRSSGEIANYPYCLSLSLEKSIKKRFQALERVGLKPSLYMLHEILGASEGNFHALIQKELKREKW
eukprot:g7513.t1